MAYTTPKTDWTTADGVDNADLNRIEENTRALYVDRTGQDLKPTDSPTFVVMNAGKVNTGVGDVECYAMNQNVKTTSSPTFSQITANGRILPTSTPLETSISIPAATSWKFPRGIYMIHAFSGNFILVSVYPGANGESLPTLFTRMVISAGDDNYFLWNNDSVARTVYYQRF